MMDCATQQFIVLIGIVQVRLWFGTPYGVSVFNCNHFENIGRKNLKEADVFLIYIDTKQLSC